ncbi:MAG: hypothetical protein M5U14_15900 [Acidimicrobiia bacterium]|nr:hypothetical protein [Acidimicrobiia bacterium]
MSRLRRFEGPDLEELLARIRGELGPDVRITGADRVRHGGIAGFFARESYEVEVEAPDDDRAPGDDPGPREEPGPTAATDERHVGGEDRGDVAPRTILELVDRVEAAERAQPDLVVSTESASFASILDRLTRDAAGPGTAAPEAAPSRAPAEQSPPPAGTRPPERLHHRRDPEHVPATVPFGPPARVLEEDAPAREGLLRLGLPPGLVPATSPGRDLRLDLAERLRGLPEAPSLPEAPGSVVAVLGDLSGALRLARALTEEIGGEPADVVVASAAEDPDLPPWLRVADPATAAERRRGWWRRSRTTIVAVDAPVGTTDERWAREVLDALEPGLAIGAVDATRKTEDVGAWAHGLGGLDALAVENLEATVSPASILALSIPVARLDGHRASPARWAKVLTERLAA